MNRFRGLRGDVRDPSGGFSLVEVLIAVSLLSGLLAAAFGLVVSGSKTVEICVLRDQLESRVCQVVDRIATDLRSARLGALIDPESLNFKGIRGRYGDGFGDYDFETGEILWDEIPESSYSFIVEASEARNGKDDDDDGLIDEGIIMKSSEGRFTRITSHVPRGGFIFQKVGLNRLYLELTLEEIDRDGRAIRATASTTVFMRN